MRKFVDLHLIAPIKNLAEFESFIRKASMLGYKMVGVPLPANIEKEKIEQLKSIAENFNLDLVTRLNLKPESAGNLLKNLRRYRRKFEVISVRCLSKAVARQAAKDRRVDLLDFIENPKKRFFDKAEAELASNSLAALEIEAKQILISPFPRRIHLISRIRTEIEIAIKYDIPVVFSSGADNLIYMRTPRDLAAFFSTLLDLSKEDALNFLSNVPKSLVERNREKLSENFVAPGIRIVKRGSDC